jgi:hypothetical protein
MIWMIWLWIGLVNMDAPVHDFYVSICEVSHNNDLRYLDIKVKTFTNDYDDALANHSGERPGLQTPDEKADTGVKIERYLREKIKIDVNQSPREIGYWYHEYVDDATWTYLRVEEVCDIEEMKIRNEVLMELFDGQTNILRVNIGDEKKYVNLTQNYRYEIFKF